MDRMGALLRSLATYPGPYVDIDDIFITGIIADHAHIVRHHSNRFFLYCGLDVCQIQASLITHGCKSSVHTETIYRLWKTTAEIATLCANSPLTTTTAATPTASTGGLRGGAASEAAPTILKSALHSPNAAKLLPSKRDTK